jgi:site-specific DNA-methyltransferase (adenine-specific)
MLDLRLCDNLQLMAEFPDNYFDLAIVDPPYGIGFSDYVRGGNEKIKARYISTGKKKWDYEIPDEKYFAELFRVSKNQIIWGGNYFPLGPTQCFIFWYKHNPAPTFAHGEYAWTSYEMPAVCFDYRYYGNLEGHTSATPKIHPTQKPIALYDFCLSKFAKPGFKILDTHLGSGSIAISCEKFGLDLVACDNDEQIFAKAVKRINEAPKQKIFFDLEFSEDLIKQTDLFADTNG